MFKLNNCQKFLIGAGILVVPRFIMPPQTINYLKTKNTPYLDVWSHNFLFFNRVEEWIDYPEFPVKPVYSYYYRRINPILIK